MADISKIKLGDTTYNIKDAMARAGTEAITAKDNNGNIYVKTPKLEVNGTSTLHGAVTSGTTITSGNESNEGVAFKIKSGTIDRDADTISTTLWGPKLQYVDKDDEIVGFVQEYQRSNGNTGMRMLVWNEKTNGTSVWNGLSIEVDKEGAASYSVSDPAAFRSAIGAAAANHTHNYLPLSGGTLTGNILMNAGGKGYYLHDAAGKNYPGIYDNGSNLWVGSTAAASTHHTGQTYISSGYNTSDKKGNATIYISVPNASNNNGTNYAVYHTGYKPSASDVGALPISGGTLTGNLVISKVDPLSVIKSTDVDLTKTNNGITKIKYPALSIHDKGDRIAVRLEEVANPNGSNGFYLYARQYNTSGAQTVQLGIAGYIAKGATQMTYSVASPDNFRSAIGAQVAGSYATTNCGGYINTLSSTNAQQWYIHGKINNSSNTARHKHDTWLVMNNDSASCWDATASATLWTTYTTANKPTPAAIGAAPASHNHSAANITSGTLSISRGGTGVTANPSMLVNLASTTAANIFATSPRPGITGTLGTTHGGLGSTAYSSEYIKGVGTIDRYGLLRVLRFMTDPVNLSGSWTTVTLTTLPAADRPKNHNVTSTGVADNTGGLGVGLGVQSDGKVTVTGRGGAPIGKQGITGELVWLVI